jgi:hypothetical protein
MVEERWIGNDWEGSGRGPIEMLSRNLHGGSEKKYEIQTEHFANVTATDTRSAYSVLNVRVLKRTARFLFVYFSTTRRFLAYLNLV